MPSLSELHPDLRPWARYLVQIGNYNGFRISVNSVYRSREAQAVLYSRYQRGLSRYPVAPPGRSMHEHRLAFDINVRQGSQSPEQAALGALWNSWGGKWSPKDAVHFSV